MSIDFDKLFNPRKEQIKTDTTEIDEILEQEEILYIISKNIILYRKEHKLTQKQLAEELNVNQTMISKLESGKYNPTFKQIYRITRILTKSSEMFKNILQEIINNLNKFNSIQFTVITNDKYKMNLEKLYVNKNNEEKIVYFPNMYTNNNRGEEYYGQYKSENSIVG